MMKVGVALLHHHHHHACICVCACVGSVIGMCVVVCVVQSWLTKGYFASPEAKKDADKMMDMVTKLAQKVHKGLNGEFCRT